jgi:siroheme synthase
VLLMGVGTLAHSAIILACGERGGDCPVAVIEDGFGARQRVTVGTLGTIAAQAAERGIRSPAVVVVGDVVRLSPYAPAAIALDALEASEALSARLAAEHSPSRKANPQ